MLTLSEERKFHLIFAHGSKSSKERCMKLSLMGAKVRGNESSCRCPVATSADPHIRFLPVAYYGALYEKALFGHYRKQAIILSVDRQTSYC